MTPASDQQGHYCLLMVTEGAARIDHEVQDFTNAHYQQGSMTVLCHSKDSVAQSIGLNSRFFIGVYTDGALLYSHDGLTGFNCVTTFIPDLAAAKAQKHFEHRSKLADGFLQGAAVCLSEQQYNVCVFMLHQAVEQCCIALVRVYMDYRLEMHNLNRLLHLCICFSDQPLRVFISGDPENDRLFGILVKSYSQSRYHDEFAVVFKDAKQLHDRVVVFWELTRTMCGQKILELCDAAALCK